MIKLVKETAVAGGLEGGWESWTGESQKLGGHEANLYDTGNKCTLHSALGAAHRILPYKESKLMYDHLKKNCLGLRGIPGKIWTIVCDNLTVLQKHKLSLVKEVGIKGADQVISIVSGILKIKLKTLHIHFVKLIKFSFSYGGMSWTILIPLTPNVYWNYTIK